MAKQKNNVVTFGLSGKVGDLLIFRQVGGKTVVSKIPERDKKVSEKQLAQRKRFQEAVFYATEAVSSPETKEIYEKGGTKGKSPYNVAIADFLNAPDIKEVDLSGYGGAAGDTVRVNVSDDFAVKSVNVRIVDASGEALEYGEAEHKVGSLWIYTATQNIDSLAGNKIIVAASDLPGNVTGAEVNFDR